MSRIRSRVRSRSRSHTPHFCLTALAAAIGAAACSSAGTPSPVAKPKAAPLDAASPKLLSPARYALTTAQGAIFDEGNKGVAVPRSEPAIVAGRRVTLEGGVVVAAARTPGGLVGFRSLPPYLGGGYLVWSDLRTYHSDSFLGELAPVAQIGPTAGARPWFSSLLLRTDRGIFELNLKARTTTRWAPHPGVVDALAIDDKRGVTLDAVGRVRATTDGGATWTDVTAARGFFASAARLGKKGEIELVSLTGAAELRLPPGGVVEPIPPPPSTFSRRYYGYGSYPYSYATPSYQPEPGGVDPFSQTLAPEGLAWATTAGLLLAGDRAIVAREEGVQILSTKTGAELDQASLLGVDTQYAGCQPVRAGASVLLACAHTQGAHVLVFDGPLAAPRLEATFPDTGSFIADERGHFAFAGRCGRTPPSVDDFGARVARREPDEEDYSSYGGGYGPYGGYGGYNPDYPEPSSEEPTEREKPPADDKRICVRLEGGHWIEHRLTGDDARDLYRWVLGEDGIVTALLLKGANPDDEEKDGEDKEKGNEKDGEDEDMRVRRKRSEHHAAPPNPTLLAQPTAPTAHTPKVPPPDVKPAAKPDAKPNGKGGTAPKPDAKKAPADAKPAVKDVPTKDGLRLVRLNPKERALKGGKWTHVAPPLAQAPWRSVEQSFWLEDGVSIRGWVRLLDDGVSAADAAAASEGSGETPSPVATELSGRFAGVRISPQGKATVLPLPAHVQSVIFGGRFGFARGEDDGGDNPAYYETTDGGATWTAVEGPPVSEMDDPSDDSRWPACSALGCTLASGLVRLGWGSPKPAAPKKEKDSFSGASADAFPVARLPRLECRFDGEPETFPAAAPKPALKPTGAKPIEPAKPASPGETLDAQREMIELLLQQAAGQLPPGLLPPGQLPPGPVGTASPVAPPPPAGSAKPSAKPAAGKPPLKPPPAKAPPPPPAEIVSLRTKPQSPLGQLKDKSWSADFVVPFDPTAAPKHASASANGLVKLPGTVVPLLGDRGVELLLSWENQRTVLGSAAAALLPFDYTGRLTSAALLSGPAGAAGKGKPSAPGTAIVALDEERRVLVLVQGDAARAVLRTAKIPDPTRGHFSIARRTDAPGVALVWYSATSGDVLVGAVDFGRAEIAPLTPLAALGKLLDGGLPQCAASAKPGAPEYEFLADVTLAVTVTAHSDKVLFTDSTVPSTVLVRATTERACAAGVEVRGGARPLDLSASFGPKGAAVARSRTSAEDPTKLSLDKLSCLLKEPLPR